MVWLGKMLATDEFSAKQAMATEMLGGLLKPTKVSLQNMLPTNPLLQSTLCKLAEFNDTQRSGSVEHMNALVQIMQKLTNVFQEEGQQRVKMQLEFHTKMEKLHEFANTVVRFPTALNKYLLIRLSEIDDAQDLSVLKEWMSQTEATEAHRLLEEPWVGRTYFSTLDSSSHVQ